ncbi:glycosyl transferase family 2 [Anoxybacter fermentans]|uniref:Glucosyl-3-phosphoglycerate synthase n=1 Tax=Anoxybacter fermentans TaxID=1323375 RepID=A0A3Q9HNZ9_9FIRM|nr:glycosyltransferase family 2 protein [Anoxybacter fermentans]AZR72384.1 glycosyl transferase family 2 [Anoxybacter fermentans]
MKVSAVIPAYNEEKTIGNVLSVVIDCPEIEEVIVVNDGSTDKTSDVVRQFPVQLIELEENRGKGAAMKVGVDRATGDVIIFLDADLIGLTVKHLQKMLAPVLNGETDMVIGIFEHGRFATDLAQKVSPFLSGQRVVKRSVIDGLGNMEMTRFGVEIALTRYALAHNIPCKEVYLENMSHLMKEEKLGLVRGFLHRLKMYWEIIKMLPRRKSSIR